MTNSMKVEINGKSYLLTEKEYYEELLLMTKEPNQILQVGSKKESSDRDNDIIFGDNTNKRLGIGDPKDYFRKLHVVELNTER